MELKIGSLLKILEKNFFKSNKIYTGKLLKVNYDPSHESFRVGAKDEYYIKLDNGKEIVIDPTYKIYNKYEIIEILD